MAWQRRQWERSINGNILFKILRRRFRKDEEDGVVEIKVGLIALLMLESDKANNGAIIDGRSFSGRGKGSELKFKRHSNDRII